MVHLSCRQEGSLLPCGAVGRLRRVGVSTDGTQHAFRQRARRLGEMSEAVSLSSRCCPVCRIGILFWVVKVTAMEVLGVTVKHEPLSYYCGQPI
jgi:hypothetical protein